MNNLYENDVAILKKYGDEKLKLTLFRSLRIKGVEAPTTPEWIRGTKYTEKLDESISRSRSTIFELAFCNDWDFFCTLTVNKEKLNRYDLKSLSRAISEFAKYESKRTGKKILYLLIPELHKDGAWHFHGFLKGITPDQLREFLLSDKKLPKYIREKLENGEKVYEWLKYREKFGWVTLEPIRNKEAASKYITKYISKNLQTSVKELNANLYYCSKGLKRAVEIKRGILLDSIPFVWENDYIKIAWLNDESKAVKLIL